MPGKFSEELRLLTFSCLHKHASASSHPQHPCLSRTSARSPTPLPQQNAILEAGGVRGMLQLLASSRPSQQEASLDALAAVVAGNAAVAAAVLQGGPGVQACIAALLKDRSPRMRFLASTTLVHLCASCPQGVQPSAEVG